MHSRGKGNLNNIDSLIVLLQSVHSEVRGNLNNIDSLIVLLQSVHSGVKGEDNNIDILIVLLQSCTHRYSKSKFIFKRLFLFCKFKQLTISKEKLLLLFKLPTPHKGDKTIPLIVST